jgi:hypothetical protein
MHERISQIQPVQHVTGLLGVRLVKARHGVMPLPVLRQAEPFDPGPFSTFCGLGSGRPEASRHRVNPHQDFVQICRCYGGRWRLMH